MRCTNVVLAAICGLLLCAGCAVDQSIIDSEAAQEGCWRRVEKELVTAALDGSPAPAELLETWKTLRIPRLILESRRRLAGLKGEEFDLAKQMEELGIKPTKGGTQ